MADEEKFKGACPLFLFLLTASCFVFFNSGFFHLDDAKLFERISFTDFDFLNSFFPESRVHYFRPILESFFYLDNFAHSLNPYSMRLENIFLHSLNVTLLYLFFRALFGCRKTAFLIALIFAVSPINAEPINWISGRTDILSSFFVLLSLNLLLKINDNYWYALISTFFYFCGLLVKELSIGYLGVLIFLLFFYLKAPIRGKISFFLFAVFFTYLYFLMRFPSLRFWDFNSSTAFLLPQGPEAKNGNPIDTGNLLVFLRQYINIIGFYIRKSVYPWPMNFAIVDITGISNYLVFILAVLSMLFFRFKNIYFGMFWFFVFIFPALFVPANRMAWTPVAERYLYFPQIGVFIAVVFIFRHFRAVRIVKKTAYALLILVFLSSLIYRNYLWSDPERLYIDTISKSPKFAPMYNELGVYYLSKGDNKNAKKYFVAAEKLYSSDKLKNITVYNTLLSELDNLTINEAIERFELLISSETDKSHKKKVINNAIRYIGNKSLYKRDEIGEQEKKFIAVKQLEYYKKLVELEPGNGFYNYKAGVLSFVAGDNESARSYLQQAYKFGKDTFYEKAANSILKKLD